MGACLFAITHESSIYDDDEDVGVDDNKVNSDRDIAVKENHEHCLNLYKICDIINNDTTTVDTGSHSMISRSITNLSQGSAVNTHLNNSYGAAAKKKGSTPLAQEIEGLNKSAGRPQTTAQNN